MGKTLTEGFPFFSPSQVSSCIQKIKPGGNSLNQQTQVQTVFELKYIV